MYAPGARDREKKEWERDREAEKQRALDKLKEEKEMEKEEAVKSVKEGKEAEELQELEQMREEMEHEREGMQEEREQMSIIMHVAEEKELEREAARQTELGEAQWQLRQKRWES